MCPSVRLFARCLVDACGTDHQSQSFWEDDVELDSDNNVVMDKFINIIDTDGTSGFSFTSETKAAMLWNFGRAATVTLGASNGGGAQFPGSILIPHGDLRMLLPGQDGRTIVFGDVHHNAWGSEFHNYEFDPPCAVCRQDLPSPSTFVPRTTSPPNTLSLQPSVSTAPSAKPSVAPSRHPMAPIAPTNVPVAPTKAPVAPFEPRDAPTVVPVAPTKSPVATTPPPFAPRSCPSTFSDLGPQLSASDYTGTFPRLVDAIDVMNPKGRESQVSLLVGGTYDGPLAAEIEGRIVVLGDFWIGENGVSSLGTYVPDSLRDPVEFCHYVDFKFKTYLTSILLYPISLCRLGGRRKWDSSQSRSFYASRRKHKG